MNDAKIRHPMASDFTGTKDVLKYKGFRQIVVGKTKWTGSCTLRPFGLFHCRRGKGAAAKLLFPHLPILEQATHEQYSHHRGR